MNVRSVAALVGSLVICLLAGCSSGSADSVAGADPDSPADRSEFDAGDEGDGARDDGGSDPAGADPLPPATGVEPEAFVPGGPVGSPAALADLIAELETELPPDLRDQVPWPAIGDPDPVQAQLAIFELWIWMAENHPEPALAPIMSVESSPSREDIVATFGEMVANRELAIREAAPYQAFDHRVVTFETAGLPLWLGRDVPDDAVVVYYQDNSGPTTIRDAETGTFRYVLPQVETRQWLSIMVPTDVGWLLFRDQLIEPGDPELEVPDPAPPSPDEQRRNPEV